MKRKSKIDKILIELKRSIHLVLSEDLKLLSNDSERDLGTRAYHQLNQLRNSLHRHKVKSK